MYSAEEASAETRVKNVVFIKMSETTTIKIYTYIKCYIISWVRQASFYDVYLQLLLIFQKQHILVASTN